MLIAWVALALPLRGSLCGGSDIEVALPSGFTCPADVEIHVSLGPAPCARLTRGTALENVVRCETTTLATAATTEVPITVACGKKPGLQAGTFVYDAALTPVVDEAGPTAGHPGDVVHLVGARLDGARVLFGPAATERPGSVKLATSGMAQVVVPPLPAGEWPLRVKTRDGFACTSEHARLSFQAALMVQSVATGAGSFGGGGTLKVVGLGLEGAEATLCGAPCKLTEVVVDPPELHDGDVFDQLHCRPGAYKPEEAAQGELAAVTCDLSVQAGGQNVVMPQAWVYSPDLTPIVLSVTKQPTPRPGGKVVVNGQHLDPVAQPGLLRKAVKDQVTVTIGGVACPVTRGSADFVECSPAHVDALDGKVVVTVAGKGASVMPPSVPSVLTPPTPPPKEQKLTLHAYTSDLCHADAAECPEGWQCCKVEELTSAYGRCSVVCL